MNVTRTAIVNINRTRLNLDDAIKLAKEVNGKICSLRYCANHMECSYGFGVYVGDELLNYKSDEYFWL